LTFCDFSFQKNGRPEYCIVRWWFCRKAFTFISFHLYEIVGCISKFNITNRILGRTKIGLGCEVFCTAASTAYELSLRLDVVFRTPVLQCHLACFRPGNDLFKTSEHRRLAEKERTCYFPFANIMRILRSSEGANRNLGWFNARTHLSVPENRNSIAS